MQIVKMEICHLNDILQVERECFSSPWTEEMFKEELLGKFSHYFVVEVNNRAVAYMGMWSLSGEGHITNIAVAKNERRKGYAKALLIHFINMAKTEHLEFMTLEVRASNAAAISLYKSFGFVHVGTRKKYYENSEDALLFTKFFGE